MNIINPVKVGFKRIRVSLPPHFIGNIDEGILWYFRKLRYKSFSWSDGAILAAIDFTPYFSEKSKGTQLANVLGEDSTGSIAFDVLASLLTFSPKPEDILVGKVIAVTQEKIKATLFDNYLAVITADNVPDSLYKFDEEFCEFVPTSTTLENSDESDDVKDVEPGAESKRIEVGSWIKFKTLEIQKFARTVVLGTLIGEDLGTIDDVDVHGFLRMSVEEIIDMAEHGEIGQDDLDLAKAWKRSDENEDKEGSRHQQGFEFDSDSSLVDDEDEEQKLESDWSSDESEDSEAKKQDNLLTEALEEAEREIQTKEPFEKNGNDNDEEGGEDNESDSDSYSYSSSDSSEWSDSDDE